MYFATWRKQPEMLSWLNKAWTQCSIDESTSLGAPLGKSGRSTHFGTSTEELALQGTTHLKTSEFHQSLSSGNFESFSACQHSFPIRKTGLKPPPSPKGMFIDKIATSSPTARLLSLSRVHLCVFRTRHSTRRFIRPLTCLS